MSIYKKKKLEVRTRSVCSPIWEQLNVVEMIMMDPEGHETSTSTEIRGMIEW